MRLRPYLVLVVPLRLPRGLLVGLAARVLVYGGVALAVLVPLVLLLGLAAREPEPIDLEVWRRAERPAPRSDFPVGSAVWPRREPTLTRSPRP